MGVFPPVVCHNVELLCKLGKPLNRLRKSFIAFDVVGPAVVLNAVFEFVEVACVLLWKLWNLKPKFNSRD